MAIKANRNALNVNGIDEKTQEIPSLPCCSQTGPWNSLGHKHLKWSPLTVQIPPFLQGSPEHGFIGRAVAFGKCKGLGV